MSVTPPENPGRAWLWLAFAWGLAEATFFFIVPDVLTSRLVLQRARLGVAACFSSLAGALLGGSLLFWLGHDPSVQMALAQAMDYLPGINATLVRQAGDGLMQHGLAALFTGVVAGIPYKLYALQAAWAGSDFSTFLLVSLFARLSRFLLVTGMTWLAGVTLFSKLSIAMRLRIHAGSWLVFYVFYFWRMSL